MKRISIVAVLLCLLAGVPAFADIVTTAIPGFDRTATGQITSNQSVTIPTQGMGVVRFIVLGTWTGTINVKMQAADGSTWVAESAYPYGPSGAAVSNITANGQFKMPCSGHRAFEVIGNTVTSGTAIVYIEASALPYPPSLDVNSGNWNITNNAYIGTFTDRSGSIATGGTAQTAMSANATRHKIIIENTSASAVVTFSFTGTAGAQGTAGSYVLQPGQFFTSDTDGCPTSAVSVYSATTGATWTASEL